MKKLLFILPLLVCCASTTKTFYRNGQLLPQLIKTRCGTYASYPLGILEENGIKSANFPYYLYNIKFAEDTSKLISIDSFQIVSYRHSARIQLHKTQSFNQIINDTTFRWAPTRYGGCLWLAKADSFSVSFLLNSTSLSCSDTQSFMLIPINATNRQLSKSFDKMGKSN